MKNNKKKVLFVIPSLDPGGIETYTLRFLKYTISEIDPYIIVRSKLKGELYQDYLKITDNIVFQPLGYANVLNALRYYFIFKKLKPVTIVDFNANFAGLSLYLAKLAGIGQRVAFYRQGKNHFKENSFKIIYNRWLNGLVNRNATFILSNSKASLDYFFAERKNTDGRFEVIPNGIYTNDYVLEESQITLREDLKIPKNKYIVGHIGRYDVLKNHKVILETAKRLIKRDLNVHFVFCGKDTEKMEPLLKELRIENHVSILGFRRDIPRVLKALDLFFFPSISEGQPNALIEAMISGAAIVASDIAPIKEFVPNEMHSCLFGHDDVAGFENAIIQSMETTGLKSNLVQEKMIKQFDSQTNFGLFLKKIV